MDRMGEGDELGDDDGQSNEVRRACAVWLVLLLLLVLLLVLLLLVLVRVRVRVPGFRCLVRDGDDDRPSLIICGAVARQAYRCREGGANVCFLVRLLTSLAQVSRAVAAAADGRVCDDVPASLRSLRGRWTLTWATRWLPSRGRRLRLEKGGGHQVRQGDDEGAFDGCWATGLPQVRHNHSLTPASASTSTSTSMRTTTTTMTTTTTTTTTHWVRLQPTARLQGCFGVCLVLVNNKQTKVTHHFGGTPKHSRGRKTKQ